MNFLSKLERKFQFLSFPNLYQYLIVVYLVGLVINLYNPYYYLWNLSLDVDMILKGQVWRLFTFIFYPPSSSVSIILSLIIIYIEYSILKTLTMIWRPFKFNLFMFIGYVSFILGAFILYFVFGKRVIMFPSDLFFSAIFAFALSFPDAVFYLYFLFPIKAKYLIYFDIVIYIIDFVSSGLANRVAIICSLVNIFLYFVIWKNKI